MKIGVTGAYGFLGWHIRCLAWSRGQRIEVADRRTMSSTASVDAFVRACDAIVHAAGVNRGTDEELAVGNIGLARTLADGVERTGADPVVVYLNSTHSESDSSYGSTKREGAEILAEAIGGRAPFVDLVLPHVFGEFGRPFYNSAITTFAHQLATGQPAEVERSGSLELVHAQDVAAQALDAAGATEKRRIRMQGVGVSVGDIWDLLARQYKRYVSASTIPEFVSPFERRVFNLLRSQLFLAGFYPREMASHRDDRGSFLELCRADGLGQTSISTTAPGVTRGDHFHFDKIERFVVVGGQGRIRLRRLLTDDVVTFDVSAERPVFVDMPPLVTHSITNTGSDELVTVFWAGDHFDPAVPDTFAEAVDGDS